MVVVKPPVAQRQGRSECFAAVNQPVDHQGVSRGLSIANNRVRAQPILSNVAAGRARSRRLEGAGDRQVHRRTPEAPADHLYQGEVDTPRQQGKLTASTRSAITPRPEASGC